MRPRHRVFLNNAGISDCVVTLVDAGHPSVLCFSNVAVLRLEISPAVSPVSEPVWAEQVFACHCVPQRGVPSDDRAVPGRSSRESCRNLQETLCTLLYRLRYRSGQDELSLTPRI